MDDLDHSVHIAERDWDIFYEESEECNLAQAELAGVEDSGLSDNDEPANPAPEVAIPVCAEDVCLGCSTVSTVNHAEAEGVVTTVNQPQPPAPACQEESCDSPIEETETQVSHLVPVATEAPKEADGVDQEDNQDSSQSPQTQSDTEQHGAEADSPAAGSVPPAERKEKERWFVTVNDSKVQLRCRPDAEAQKKRRKKKTSRSSARIVAGWERYLSPSETETETERCEESKSDLTKMTKTSCTTVSQLPEKIPSSENTMPQDQALKLNSPNQEALCTREKEKDCRSTILNVDHLNLTEQPSTQLPQTFSVSENSSSIPIWTLPSETLSLPNTDQLVADKGSHTCPTILLHETTSTDSSKTEESPQGLQSKANSLDPSKANSLDPSKANSLDPSNNPDHVPRRLATFNTDGGEAPSPPPEESESKECVIEESLTEALDPDRPVFAISSFWDEMEKLTINDILHLRCADNQSLSTHAVHLHEYPGLPDSHDSSPLDPANICDHDSVPLDALDNADSDYFTHLDDSKPDRSSCEFSTFSDFDEDLLQMISTSPCGSPEPQENMSEPAQTQTQTQTPTQRFSDLLYSQAVLDEQEMELVRHAKPESEFTQLYFDTGIPLLLCSDAESSSQTLSPAGSEYDMAALESDIVREACFKHVLQDEVVNTMLFFPCEETQDTSLLLADCDIVKAMPSPVSSTSSFLEDSHVISLNDMFETCEDAPHASLFDSSGVSPQIYSENLSVPEAYDYFFSDFDERNLFFPLKHELKERAAKTVPIFSCSRSLVRDLTFPEVEQFIEAEEEDNWGPIRVISRFSGSGSLASAAPDAYLYSGRSWKSILSLRRLRFAGMRNNWCQRARAWVSPGSLFQTISRSSSMADMTRGACSSLQVFHLGDPVLRKLALQQTRLPDQPYKPKKKCFLFSLRQSDMCLVCIAFASWVLKSTNLQSGETWKAALLANVSAISAIQYLRLYKTSGAEP